MMVLNLLANMYLLTILPAVMMIIITAPQQQHDHGKHVQGTRADRFRSAPKVKERCVSLERDPLTLYTADRCLISLS